MDALLMCGGRGTRLDAPVEKPLFEVGGRPMVERVRAALAASGVGETYAVVSPHAPETRARLSGRAPLIETPGEGYVADLGTALDDERLSEPVLTVAADLPLLAPDTVDAVLRRHGHDPGASLTVAVPAALKRRLGASVDGEGDPLPAGVNVVADGDRSVTHVTYDARLAVNVNRRADAAVAEELLEVPAGGEGERGMASEGSNGSPGGGD